MQRRSFLQLITAAATAPLMPRIAVAAPAVFKAPPLNPYIWAKHHARIEGQLTAARLHEILGPDVGNAEALLARLRAENILASGADGVYKTTQHFRDQFKPALRKLADGVKELADIGDDSDSINPDLKSSQHESSANTSSLPETDARLGAADPVAPGGPADLSAPDGTAPDGEGGTRNPT